MVVTRGVQDEAASQTVGVTLATDEHSEALAAFYRRVWDRDATPEKVRRGRVASAATNPVNPKEPAPTIIFLKGGDVIGQVTTIPVRAWLSGRDVPAHWVKGLMVLPDYRNGPVGFMLLREAVAQVGEHLSMGLVVEEAARRMFRKLGYSELGAVPNFLLPLRAGRILQSLDTNGAAASGLVPRLAKPLRAAQRLGLARFGGDAISLALRARRALIARGGPGFDVLVPSADDVDCLWASVRHETDAAVARDGAYIRRRYLDTSDRYRVVAVRQHAGIEAVAIIRHPPDVVGRFGIRIAALAELIAPRDAAPAAHAALAAAEQAALEMGADGVGASASSPVLGRLLRSRGYLRLSGNMRFMVRPATSAGDVAPPDSLADWWLTRGDSAADDGFG